MIHSLILPLTFDVNLMQRDLNQLESELWIDHFVKQNYEGQWSVIPLRSPETAKHPVMMIYSDPVCKKFVDTPFLKKLDYFSKILKSFQCPLKAVRLMKLSAGSKIKEHTDLDMDIESGTIRLHIPVQTNHQVDFRLNGDRVQLREGECWYLRLSDPHSVENRGKQDRVHLVIDAELNQWLKQFLLEENKIN